MGIGGVRVGARSVVLVPMNPARDAAELFKAAHPVQQTLRYVMRCPKDETPAAFREWLEVQARDPGRLCWTVRLAASGSVVGEACLVNLLTIPEPVVWIGPNADDAEVWHDTLDVLVEEAFGRRSWHRLQIVYHTDDLRMKHVTERLAVPLEGVMREAFDNGDGTWSDMVVTGLLRKEWTPMAHAEKDELTVEESFARMPRRFRGDRADGVTATIQWEIDGEGGGIWNAVIDAGACTITKGPSPDPNLILQVRAEDWLCVVRKTQSPYDLYLSRKLLLYGDVGLAMKLRSLFSTD